MKKIGLILKEIMKITIDTNFSVELINIFSLFFLTLYYYFSLLLMLFCAPEMLSESV